MPDWKDVVRTVAPTIAAALGGPLAGTAAAAIGDAVFGDRETDPARLEATIQGASPDVLAALKRAELEFQATIAALDIDLERIQAGDRDSARRREIEVKDRTPAIMGGAILIGFFGAFAAMLFIPFPDTSKEAMFILLGVLGGMATSVSNYFYGSSSGSAIKSKLLARKTD